MSARKPLPTVQLTLSNCAECPHSATESYSLDGFDRGDRYRCRKQGGKVIEEWVEWSDPRPSVPSWCPLRAIEKRRTKKARSK